MASGTELLIVDGSDRDREGLRKFFDGKGYVCTAVGTADEAKALATKKFFPVALIDLDVGGEGHGVDLVRYVRSKSRPTAVILITSRASFDGAVEGLRAGVIDVVQKTRGQAEHLIRTVERAQERQAAQGGELYREVRAVLDDSFKVMLGLSRKVYAHLSLAATPLKPRVLIVDPEQEFLKELSQLVQDKDWDVAGEMNGGGALDRGSSTKLDIIATRDELPDLRGSMVIRSIQAQHGDVLGLLYTTEGDGKIERIEHGQVEDVDRPFTGAAQLIEKIDAVVEELGTRTQERRFIQAFSADHRDFLKRYAELKLKIDRLISD
ncbi:MAG: response regulator [Sandaracinaceae bacterium]